LAHEEGPVKAFRGSLLALFVLVLVAVVVLSLKPEVTDPLPSGEVRLFEFEKHELVRVEVARAAADSIVLVEQEGHWLIEGTDFVAGRSMVNRFKHQLHDLTSRATVVEDVQNAALYGLEQDTNATTVTLTMRDGRTIAFLAGDPNPSSVSYYIRPLPGETIYTVKKSAVDYTSLLLEEFRERRFASFDSKDTSRIVAELNLDGAQHILDIERVGDRDWQMHSPVTMAANDDRVRRLLGRVSALKARHFIERSDENLAEYGLDDPRAVIELRFASRDPLVLKVGADAPGENRYEELAYMLLEGDDTIYVSRRGMLDEFAQDPAELRNRRVVRMDGADVRSVDVALLASEEDDLSGEAGVRYAAEQWVWKDGVPVPGSTPKRAADQLAGLEVDAFVDDAPGDLSTYGLVAPIARAVLRDEEDNERVVLIGGEGEPEVDPEGNTHVRRYASIEGDPSVYLIDDRALRVVQDLVRESNRKAERDAERAARRELIPSEAYVEEEGSVP